jgi:plastocyanin
VSPRSRTTRFIALVIMAATALAACSSASSSPHAAEALRETSMTGSAAAIVRVRTFRFAPHTLRLQAGTTVQWRNDDEIAHTVTSGMQQKQGVPGVSSDRPARPDGAFDHRLDGAGSTVTVRLDEAGTYPYFCDIHAGMSGVIVVS